MLIKFTKMHGLGNDFMVVDTISQHAHFRPEQIKRLSNRYEGIGFDQLLLVEPPAKPDVDFSYRIFNADGNEVEQCGNGARCFALYVKLNGLTDKDKIKVATKNGIIELNIIDEHRVTVDMGEPLFTPEALPFLADSQDKVYALRVEQEDVEISAVSMGNPHAVLQVDDVNTARVAELGPKIESHERFPQNVNVGFMEVVHPRFIKLRVFERGVGETNACGTGACAAVAVGLARNLLQNPVEVKLPGGNLNIDWEGPGHHLKMSGPATTVYEGTIRI